MHDLWFCLCSVQTRGRFFSHPGQSMDLALGLQTHQHGLLCVSWLPIVHYATFSGSPDAVSCGWSLHFETVV
jgi:hypothetical protein